MTRYSLLLLIPLLLIGCTTDEPFPALEVDLTAANLPQLEPSEGQYVLWASYPDDPTSPEKPGGVAHSSAAYVPIGAFVVDPAGAISSPAGGPIAFSLPEGYNPQLIFDAIITVERPGSIPEDPGARLLAGAVEGSRQQGTADLTVGGADAFGRNFFDDERLEEGRYGLVTPSTTETDDENQGLWFFSGTSAPGLPLDSLSRLSENRGWSYEAWVIDSADRSYTLGRFDAADVRDSDGAGSFGGPIANPLQLPGSDFVEGTLLILNDGTFGVTVALQPTSLGLERPFYTLYHLDRIDAGTTTGVAFSLPYTRVEPVVSITFSR